MCCGVLQIEGVGVLMNIALYRSAVIYESFLVRFLLNFLSIKFL